MYICISNVIRTSKYKISFSIPIEISISIKDVAFCFQHYHISSITKSLEENTTFYFVETIFKSEDNKIR